MVSTRWALVSSACFGLMSLSAPAIAGPAEVRFDIPAGPLEAALVTYGAQARRQILFDPAMVAGHQAPAIRGPMGADAALARLLEGSSLRVRETQPGVFTLQAPPSPPPSAPGRPSLQPQALARAGQAVASGPADDASVARAPTLLDELIITGTLIRGSSPPSSPVLQLDGADIEAGGHATVGDMLAALPQNFGGSGSAAAALVGTDPRTTNDLAATGLNLRGLGASATLVLVNGRRMAGVGTRGDFADASAIPTAVVERVDVLLDGASALYGSDAVGGVVNVILKRRLDAPESRLHLSAATQGGAEELQASHAWGTSWSSGDLVLAYEYGKHWGLRAEERPFTATSDLRSLGGGDWRTFYSHPANILTFDAQSGSYVVGWAVPPGQSGRNLTPGDFIAGGANLENQRQGGDVLPADERHNLYASVVQALGANVRLLSDVRYNRRDNLIARPASVSVFTVTRANPFFVSPNGSSSHVLGYAFGDEVGPSLSDGRAESLGLSGGLEIDLPAGWRADIYGSAAFETGERDTERLINSRFVSEALGSIADDPATSFSAPRDGYFNPFGDGGANGPAVLDFIGSGYTRGRTLSRVLTFDAKADGDLFETPAGVVQAALGVQARQERFKTTTKSLVSTTAPVHTGGVTYKRNIEAAFLELRVPLVGADMGVPGVDRLELSVAARTERYGDFGRTTNPKVGLLWAPMEGLRLRASYGTSFRAPNLTEIYQTQNASPVLVGAGASQTLALVQTGGNLNLEPETATTWSAGFDFEPDALPGLSLSATWFDVTFSDQIGQPVLADIPNALSHPAYEPFVTPVDPNNPADLAWVEALMAASTSSNIGLFPASAYRAVIDARYVNTGEVVVRGLDLAAAYAFRRGDDAFEVTAAVNYLADYVRRFTPTAEPVQFVDQANQPVDLRGRVTGSWRRGAYGVSATFNYVDDSHSAAGEPIEAYTPVDLQLRWTPKTNSGPIAGLTANLTVSNLFDEDPPFYNSPLGVGFDPANADPLGRTVSLSLTKRW